MIRLRQLFWALLVMLVYVSSLTTPLCAQAQAPTAATPPAHKVQAALVSPTTAFHPGKPFTVGLRQQIAPHWHTYWINPGDSGEPTRLTWELPPGFTASPIRWPIPDAIRVGPLMNYGYSDRLLLPVVITPPANFDGASVTLKAKAEWLVCEKICVPEEQVVTLALAKAAAGQPLPSSADAPAFEATRRAMPVRIDWPTKATLAGKRLTLSVAATGLERKRITSATFFPEKWGVVDHPAPQRLRWSSDGFSLELAGGELLTPGKFPTLTGVLVLTEKLEGREVRQGFTVSAPITVSAAPAGATGRAGGAANSAGGGGPSIALWQAMVFALLGGIILNLMPCVLPILSLKVLALARHGDGDATRGGIAYLAGVVVSFSVLAVLLIGLRLAGEQLGWGFQFQSPSFVLAMIALFF
ncbi:MAG: thiol:disulfide interchange protein, partial [Hyphomicrobiaceae bacterium]|nr:thiol:disulfide interchange protein [Hyphomicrobiaceae bacterium]